MTDPSIPFAYVSVDIPEFCSASPTTLLGTLTGNSDFAVETTQADAWLGEIGVLQEALAGFNGTVFMEFIVPRIGSRIDVALIMGGMIFVLEFKVGESEFTTKDMNQVWDYALDLKNFHKGSHHAAILPLLVATEAEWSDTALTTPHTDGVYPPVRCNAQGLGGLLQLALREVHGTALIATEWGRAAYSPTPTIIEAAQALYSHHTVDAITRNDAGARNLSVTTNRVERVIEEALKGSQKAIVFVTGVPGAGKTLVGLNVATHKRESSSTHATYLSGNGPLVAVLSEALTRDELHRLRRQGGKPRKGHVEQKVKAFIQNVHHFRDAALKNDLPPSDRVVIFDEAQRAWDAATTAGFMKKRNGAAFTQSEPEFLISCLDRHVGWAVVICLVGGGQEINRGETGISAWFDALRERFPNWRVYVSPTLSDSEYSAGDALSLLEGRANVEKDADLHLATSMRSFRAENVSAFVKAVLDCDEGSARNLLSELTRKYPIALTRDIRCAKRWIQRQARGSERYGLVASSQAQRLKPHAIDVRFQVNPVHWFLGGPDDTRSSYYMEDAATEFKVQGLELDWVCMTWDADLRFAGRGWSHHSFRGSRWQNIRQVNRKRYLLNAYRVLLTRARQGMVIFVPEGEPSDATRMPAHYDATYEYLAGLGIPAVGS